MLIITSFNPSVSRQIIFMLINGGISYRGLRYEEGVVRLLLKF
jgi:hypothetical protein